MSSAQTPIVSTVTTTASTEDKPIPEGYVFLYPGIRKADNTYTSPILSVHLYNSSASTTKMDSTQTIPDNKPNRRSPAYRLGTVQSSRENTLSLNELVLLIPVEDILSICYRTDTKREVKFQKTSIPIANLSKEKGCCDKFCSCCCNESEEPEPERRRDETIENKTAKRVIIVTIEHVRYGRIDTPSHVRVLNESDRVAFYSSRMNVDILQFYLLVSDEFDPIQFNLQRNQAEALSCLITHIKQMASTGYPSETQLQELVQMEVLETFGTQLQETLAITQITAQPIKDDRNDEFF